MDNTDKLIDRLSADLKPTKVVTLLQLMAVWSGLGVIIFTYYLYSVGARADLSEKLFKLDYVFALLLYIEIFVFASWLTMRSVIPGRQPRRLLLNSAILGLSTAAAVALYAGVKEWSITSLATFDTFAALACCLRISLGALLPASVLLVITELMAPLNLKVTAAYMWFTAATLVSIVSQLNCPIDGFSHVVIGHGILIAITGIFGWFIFWITSIVVKMMVDRHRIKRVTISQL